MTTYLIRAGKAETTIDDFLGSDPTGQYVIFRKANEVWLLDTTSDARVDLAAAGADLADDASSYTPHRALSFDPMGRRLAYLRQGPDGTDVVIHDLKTGSEREYPAGRGTVGRIAFEPDGQFVRLDVVTTDTNGNGRIQWPFPPRSDASGRCPGPIPTYKVWQWPGDDARVRLLDLATSNTEDVDGFVMTLAGSVITRDEEGALVMRLPNGKRRKISSKQCAAKILHVDPETESVVFGCAGAYAARRDIYVRTATGRRRLELDLAPFEIDSRFGGRPSWIALYPRNDTVLVHLSAATAYTVTAETRVLATYGTHALAERAERYFFLSLEDPDARSTKVVERAIGAQRAPVSDIIATDRYVAVGRDLFDIAEMRSMGQFERPPLAVSNDGYGFIPSKSPQMRSLSQGPLHWKRPSE